MRRKDSGGNKVRAMDRKFVSRTILLFPLALLSAASLLVAQDSTQVKLAARLVPREIPLNREGTLYVEASWRGQPGAIRLSPIDLPLVTNFKITATASSNIVKSEGGQTVTIRRYEFKLQPETLGMAYVDAVRLEYEDADGNQHSLQAPRLQAKGIDPVADPGESNFIQFVIAGLAIVFAAGGGVLYVRHRKQKRARELAAAAERVSLEEEYLQKLASAVDVHATHLAPQYEELSNLLRSYLRAAFHLDDIAATTEELLHALERTDLPEDHRNHIQEILQNCDVVKFSGSAADPGQFARFYTLTEELLRWRKSAPESVEDD